MNNLLDQYDVVNDLTFLDESPLTFIYDSMENNLKPIRNYFGYNFIGGVAYWNGFESREKSWITFLWDKGK